MPKILISVKILVPVICSLPRPSLEEFFRCRPLNYIPIPVLNGLFLYLAVTALSGWSTEGRGLLKLITCVGHVFTALLRKSVVRADNPFVHGADCLPPKPLHQVAEIKVETLNVVELVKTNMVGKTAFEYFGRKIVGQIFLKRNIVGHIQCCKYIGQNIAGHWLLF